MLGAAHNSSHLFSARLHMDIYRLLAPAVKTMGPTLKLLQKPVPL
jgi:hypothetical protein